MATSVATFENEMRATDGEEPIFRTWLSLPGDLPGIGQPNFPASWLGGDSAAELFVAERKLKEEICSQHPEMEAL